MKVNNDDYAIDPLIWTEKNNSKEMHLMRQLSIVMQPNKFEDIFGSRRYEC